ncbi:MAG: cell division protein ZapE [Rhodanobacteraceae bacterium]|nr:MAG: cell division protein ZapE [Rhodanobacteraceae bacterium]
MDAAVNAGAALPSVRYARGVAAGAWQDDPAQRKALVQFDRLQRALVTPPPGWFARLRARAGRRLVPVQGLYLWGQVGRGKTLLMDQFVDSLPGGMALRVHFHHFMLDVQSRLRELGEVRDPLRQVAAGVAARARVLCLDEFMVTDIGDAMILSGLLGALFARGVALVTTSNTPPAELYQGGLQRARFVPAIALLEHNCAVVELASGHDWRLRALTRAPVYLTPDDARAEAALGRLFAELAQGTVRADADLAINDRTLRARRVCAQAVWFDFAALCEGPYASADYIELARTYPAILISRLPQFTPFNEDAAQRFVHLIDELYDRRVKLAVTAQAPTIDLYDGRRLRGDFARTISRLIEMQSREYLAQAHRVDQPQGG